MAHRIVARPAKARRIDPDHFREVCERHAKNLAFIRLPEASAITKEYGRGYEVSTLRLEHHRHHFEARKIGRDLTLDWSQLLDFLEAKIT